MEALKVLFENPFKYLTKFEWTLWGIGIAGVTLAFVLSGFAGVFSFIASLFGITSLIFLAKGMPISHVFMLIFATMYGINSLQFHYYGELFTYMGMTGPVTLIALITWLRHPKEDADGGEVEISHMSTKKWVAVLGITLVVTIVFYFILKALDTPNLIVSTFSVFTSCLAAILEVVRSSYYALGYVANDIVLVILWGLASMEDISYLPMVINFAMFLFNDSYGFYSWRKRQKLQS